MFEITRSKPLFCEFSIWNTRLEYAIGLSPPPVPLNLKSFNLDTLRVGWITQQDWHKRLTFAERTILERWTKVFCVSLSVYR